MRHNFIQHRQFANCSLLDGKDTGFLMKMVQK